MFIKQFSEARDAIHLLLLHLPNKYTHTFPHRSERGCDAAAGKRALSHTHSCDESSLLHLKQIYPVKPPGTQTPLTPSVNNSHTLTGYVADLILKHQRVS